MAKKIKELHPFMVLAGIDDETEFYKKYPTEEDFFRDYPQAQNGYTLNGIPTLEQSGALGYDYTMVQPVAGTPLQQNVANSASSSAPSTTKQANTAGVIQSVAEGVGNVIDNIGGVMRAVQVGAPQLLNALIPDNRVERVRTPQVGYNQYAYGTGSQMMYENGGAIPAEAAVQNPIFDVSVEGNSITPLSPTFARIGGKPHSQGGTEVQVLSTGETIEAQRNEPISKQFNGDLVAWGKMKNPHTGNTFERDANILSEVENHAKKIAKKGNKLQDSSNTLEVLTGGVLTDAAKTKDIDLSIKKEIYAKTQQDILNLANAFGTDAKKLSKEITKKAADGATMSNPPATYSDEQIEQFRRQGNWGQNVFNQAVENTAWFDPNIPRDVSGYQQYWVNNYPELVQAAFDQNVFQNPFPNTNKGYAKYPVMGTELTPEQRLYAFQDGLAGNRTVQVRQRTFANQQELDEWTKSRKPITSNNQTFYVGDEAGTYEVPVLNSRQPVPMLYDPQSEQRLARATAPRAADPQPIEPTQSIAGTPIRQNRIPSAADQNKIRFTDILPEIMGVLDRPSYVQGQEYRPQYAQPYQVSFQDRINQGTAEFNRVQNAMQNDPLALATVAAQQRRASDSVQAEEFRTNQAIEAAVLNQNLQLFNQATLQNLQLADQQYIRQETAKANTEAAQRAALQSISDKFKQNRLENTAIRLMENFTKFRPDEYMNLQSYNEPAQVVDAQGRVWKGR